MKFSPTKISSFTVYPKGIKCTSNAFFFHAEDGKILLFHSSTSVVVNWQPDSEIRVSGGFSLLWRTFVVRRQTRTP